MFFRKLIIGIVLISAIVLPTMLAAASEAALIFLMIEPNSRAGAMGQSFVAQADDGFAAYWNPGATAFNRGLKVGWTHTNWFSDVKGLDDMYYNYVSAYCYFDGLGNLGINFSYFTYGEQKIIDSSGTEKGTFDSSDLSVGFLYGYQFSRNIGIGANAKFIYSSLVPDNLDVSSGNNSSNSNGDAISFAFDFGVKWKDIGFRNFVIKGLDYGIALQNLGPSVTYNDKEQEDPLPLNLRTGFSYRAYETKIAKLVINADMSEELSKRGENPLVRVFSGIFDNMDDAVFSAGAEFIYLDILALRTGYHYDHSGKIEGMSFGAGIHYTFSNRYYTSLDFAFQPAGELTDWNKTFSVSFYF